METVTLGQVLQGAYYVITQTRMTHVDPNATDSFNENIYEYEPEVMELEMKEALRHISNRKSA